MLTAQRIARAKSGDVLTDSRHRGLRLVISAKTKAWTYRYRIGDKLKQVTLGHYPAMDITAATTEWGRRVQGRRDGRDPAAEIKLARKTADEAAKPAVTVRDIVSTYLREHIERRRSQNSARTVRYMFEGHLLPAIGRQAVDEIDAPAATRLLRSIAAKTPAIARELRVEAAAAWSHAIAEGVIKPMNPWREAMRGKLKVSRRTRYLDDAEIRTLLAWLPESGLNANVRDALELTLRTACRSGEIVRVRWNDVDLDAGSFSLRKTKTDQPRTVRYPEAVAKIIDRRRKDTTVGATFVFSAPADARRHWEQQRLGNAIVDVREVCPVKDWTPHDLRRTARTLMARLGVPNEVAEAALGHTRGGIEAVYNLYRYEAEVGEALAKLNDHIDQLLASPAKPIPIRRKREHTAAA